LLAKEQRGFGQCFCNIFYIHCVFIILEINIDVPGPGLTTYTSMRFMLPRKKLSTTKKKKILLKFSLFLPALQMLLLLIMFDK